MYFVDYFSLDTFYVLNKDVKVMFFLLIPSIWRMTEMILNIFSQCMTEAICSDRHFILIDSLKWIKHSWQELFTGLSNKF